MVPLYLRHIPVEMYGAWLASGNILFWLTSFDMGIANVVMQRVGNAYGRNDVKGVNGFATAGVVLCAGLASIIVICGLLLAPHMPALVRLPETAAATDLSAAFRIAIFGAGISIVGFAISAVNRGLQESLSVGMIAVSAQAVALVGILIGVLMGYGVYALALGILIRPVVDIFGNLWVISQRASGEGFRPSVQTSCIKDIAKMLGFTSLGRTGLAISDRVDAFLLARLMGPEVVPVYILTRRGMDVAKAILVRPGNAFSPTVAHLMGEGKIERGREVLTRFLRILFWSGGSAIAGFLALNEAFVSLWVGTHLYAGQAVNTSFVAVLFLGIVGRNLGLLCTAMGDIRNIALATFFRAVLIVLLMVYGIKYFGLLGAAMAPLGGFLFIYMPYVFRSFHKYLQLGRRDWFYQMREAIISLGLAGILAFLFPIFGTQDWLGFICNGLALALIYMSLLAIISRPFRCELRGILLLVVKYKPGARRL